MKGKGKGKGKGKAKAKPARRRKKAGGSDDDGFGGADPPLRKRSTRRKKATGYGKKMAARFGPDGQPLEAEEGEAMEAGPPSKKRRKRDDVTVEEKETYVQALLDDMMKAADEDRKAFEMKRPGFAKMALLERVRVDLLKTDLHDTLLEGPRQNKDEGAELHAGRTILQVCWCLCVYCVCCVCRLCGVCVVSVCQPLPSPAPHALPDRCCGCGWSRWTPARCRCKACEP